MNARKVVVLMAEDNEHDVVATQRAWKRNNIANPLIIVNDGEECLDYLRHKGKYADPASSPAPHLLLLDLNMPKRNGLEVLEEIRGDPQLRRLPVVVLTTSKAEEDKLRSYDLGVNAYIVKPVDFDKFASAVKAINLFWELVSLPGVEA